MNDEAYEVNVSPESTAVEVEAIVKLVEFYHTAVKLRGAMDFCARHCRLEDMLANGLTIEATLEYSRRAKCSVVDAREYVSRVLAERAAEEVASPTVHEQSVH